MRPMMVGTVLAAALAAASAAGAGDGAASSALSAEVAALGQRIFKAANSGDMPTILAGWSAGDHAIVDNCPPFSWRGPDALSAWLASYARETAAAAETEQASMLRPPLYVRTDGARV